MDLARPLVMAELAEAVNERQEGVGLEQCERRFVRFDHEDRETRRRVGRVEEDMQLGGLAHIEGAALDRDGMAHHADQFKRPVEHPGAQTQAGLDHADRPRSQQRAAARRVLFLVAVFNAQIDGQRARRSVTDRDAQRTVLGKVHLARLEEHCGAGPCVARAGGDMHSPFCVNADAAVGVLPHVAQIGRPERQRPSPCGGYPRQHDSRRKHPHPFHR